MDRIMPSVRDFTTGVICFFANVLVTLVGATIADIQLRQVIAIIIVQIGLCGVTVRCWSSK